MFHSVSTLEGTALIKEATAAGNQGAVDIKKFVNDKAPRSDVPFAATVAYYHIEATEHATARLLPDRHLRLQFLEPVLD